MTKTLNGIVLAALLCSVLLAGYGYVEASGEPLVRTASLTDPDWLAGAPPIRLVLLADTHVQGPDMPPTRLRRIVQQINALEPDLIVLAGDYAASHRFAARTYSIQEAVEPLGHLSARMGVVGVLGNHDRGDPEQVRASLRALGVTVLEDEAVQRGPIAIGGIRRRIPPAVRMLRQLNGTKILVAHSPDAFARLPSTIPLMLAGHTHCGQVVVPMLGAIATGSRHGSRYMCGMIQESGKTLIVTAGVGTSRLPLRFGAPPDIWLITVGPDAALSPPNLSH